MTKLVIAIGLVVLVLVGGLMKLLRNSSQPMGSPAAIERAKRRNAELEAEEKREGRD